MTENSPTPTEPENSTDRLEEMLTETEELSAQLRRKIRLQRQHEAVDQLPQLMSAADQGKWSNLRLLMQEILNDFRGHSEHDSNKDEDQDQGEEAQG